MMFVYDNFSVLGLKKKIFFSLGLGIADFRPVLGRHVLSELRYNFDRELICCVRMGREC